MLRIATVAVAFCFAAWPMATRFIEACWNWLNMAFWSSACSGFIVRSVFKGPIPESAVLENMTSLIFGFTSFWVYSASGATPAWSFLATQFMSCCWKP